MKHLHLMLASALSPGLAFATTTTYDEALKLSETVITGNRDVQPREHSSTPTTPISSACSPAACWTC